jgi:hypothetical protein
MHIYIDLSLVDMGYTNDLQNYPVALVSMKGLMTEYVDTLREGIRAGNGDLLLDVAYAFEKHRGLGKTATGNLGWTEKIIRTDFSDNDIALLKVDLVQFIQNNLAHPEAGTAIWALGKLIDASLKPTLIAILQQQITQNADAFAMFQTMIALENLGENLFGDMVSRSILDAKENRALAEDYLRRTTES